MERTIPILLTRNARDRAVLIVFLAAVTIMANFLYTNRADAHVTSSLRPAPAVHSSASSHPSSYNYGGAGAARYGTFGSWELDVTFNGWTSTFRAQSDGNLVLTANGHVTFASGTNGRVSTSGYIEFARNGSIRIYASNGGQVIWSQDSNGPAGVSYYSVDPAVCPGRMEFVKEWNGPNLDTRPLHYFGAC